MSKDRIMELQRQLKIARSALERIKYGVVDPQSVAEEALDKLFPLDPKQPLQGLCGHERRRV
ncbi:hypothetical protein [Labrys neptuniae]